VFFVEELITHPLFKEGECWENASFEKDEKIVEEGESSRDLFVVIKGSVRVLGSIEVTSKSNCQIRPGVFDISAGEIFGELSLFDQQPRSATIVCLEDCEVIVIDGDKLMLFLEENSDIGYKFMCEVTELLVKRLRVSNDKVFSLFAWGLKTHKIDEHLS